jgi:hypothetical protein
MLMPRITQTPYCVLVMSLLIGGLFAAWLCRSPVERRSADESQQRLDVSASTTRWSESEAWKLETLANQKHSVIPEGLSVYTLIDAGWTPMSDLIQLQGNPHELQTVLWASGVRGVCFEGRALSQSDIDELALIRTLETVQFLKCSASDGLDWTPLRQCSARLITWGQGTISDRQFEALLDNLPPDIVALGIGFSPIQDSMISHVLP